MGKAARLLAAIEDLAPAFAARAEEIERQRRIPADIVATLREVGLFSAMLPRMHGGLRLSFPKILPVIEALAASESSVGWVAMTGVNAQLFCTRLSRETYDKVYSDNAGVLVAGSGIPVGRAEIVEGGYLVSGRWPFASGCESAQWLMGHCIVCRDGAPVISGENAVTTFVILPVGRWRIEDTWRSSGLIGSGSHHIVLDGAYVTEAETFDPQHGPSIVTGPLAGAIAPLVVSSHGAVAVGIAAGAIADLVAAVKAGRRQMFASVDLRESPAFQHELGRLGAMLRAARALLHVQAADHWRRAALGASDANADFAEALQGSAWIHTACTDIVSGCYTLGGASSVLSSSPLQRRLRDIHAVRQHTYAQERFYGPAAKRALGFPVADPIFG